MKMLFLDESGDHNLTVVDPFYPVFVLGGVIIDQDYADGQLCDELDRFKQRLFGTTDIVLHTADITRNRNGFEELKDPDFRAGFYEDLNALMRRLEFQVLACVIQKDEHLIRYGAAALDPYILSLDILIERFWHALKGGSGAIITERRGRSLDRQLELAWENLKNQGTNYVRAIDIERRILGLNHRPKSDNLAGLQLADLVVSPIGHSVLGKPPKEDWNVLQDKFRRGPDGQFNGYGLVVLPKRN